MSPCQRGEHPQLRGPSTGRRKPRVTWCFQDRPSDFKSVRKEHSSFHHSAVMQHYSVYIFSGDVQTTSQLSRSQSRGLLMTVYGYVPVVSRSFHLSSEGSPGRRSDLQP
ncbi:uncharacterized protein UTRI_05308 [Ustilago trichophora]|uniref:Uncharacterized protein n=1 Tax=Ustilago trichophora TaxID=86804 RepID=A0A5C3EMG5_9BASI|nr:uncharacterized protein UTRI_05308 [Ustilago trichophora]